MLAEVAAGETTVAAVLGLVGALAVSGIAAGAAIWQGRKTRRQGTVEHFMARDMLQRHDEKLDRIDSKVDRIDTKVDRLDERVDELEIADRRRESNHLGEGA